MSLLEDVFLQDEANEAQEIERVIEGDEYDERPRSLSPSDDESDGGKREDEAEEDKRRVDPASTKAKKVTKNPRFVLNPARLTGPRGIQVIPEHFKDYKFKGKGHEKEDLDMVLKKLEHWAYRLYPKFEFQDCLKKIETLGRKRPVMVHLHKIRTDQFMSEETVVQKDSSDDETQPPQEEDEFDKLLRQQIELARATPAPDSIKKAPQKSDNWDKVMRTPVHDDRLSLLKPKATSSPSISDEQKERMLRNRRLAEERRLARLKQQTTSFNNTTSNTIKEIDEEESSVSNLTNENNLDVSDQGVKLNKKNNRSNVIDSSDSDEDVATVNESIVVDVHHNRNPGEAEDNAKLIHDEEEQMILDDESVRKGDSDAFAVPESHSEHLHTLDVADTGDNHAIAEEKDDINNDSGANGLGDNVDSVKETNKVIVEINDIQSKETKDNIDDERHQRTSLVGDDYSEEQNLENEDKNEESDENSEKLATDENKTQKEDIADVMDVDFSEEF